MYFKPGELVVKIYSKASLLKNRVFKVLYRDSISPNVRVVNAYGKQKNISYYHLRSLTAEESALVSQVTQAEEEVVRRRNLLYMFQREVKEISSYFPKI